MNKSVILVGAVGNHHSLYKNILELLISEFEYVTFLTDPRNASLIQRNSNVIAKVKIIEFESSSGALLKRNSRLINQHDIAFIDEFFGSFTWLPFVKIICRKRVLITHNVNKWLNPKMTADFKSIVNHCLKRKFFSSFDAHLTIAPNVRRYFLNIQSDKPVYYIPFDSTPDFEAGKKPTERIQITIPGTISSSRRNYDDLLKEIEKYVNSAPETNIRFVFLGRVTNESDFYITRWIDKINLIHPDLIKYWNEFIAEEEFESELNQSSFLLSNLNVVNNYIDRIEVYGQSKESGISFAMYKNCIPGIVPIHQQVLEGFDDQIIRFESYASLLNIFSEIDQGKFNSLTMHEKAKKNKTAFDKLALEESKRILEFIKS